MPRERGSRAGSRRPRRHRSRRGRSHGAHARELPTCSCSCSTTSASRSWAATAPTSARRTFDRLAAGGLRYRDFHTTAICSPTRACLLTGRNHHSNGVGHHPGDGDRLPRLQRHGPAGERLPLGDAAGARLRDALHRQVAPDARERVRVRRIEGALAAVARLRALLRLPRRQDQPVGADAGSRQPLRRAAASSRGGLSPERRPGRSRDRVRHRPAHRRAGQAVLHVLLPRRRPRAAPRRAGCGSSAIAGSSTPAGTGGARQRSRVSSRSGIVPAGHAAFPAAIVGQRVGLAAGGREAPLRAPDGSVCGVPRADRPSHRPRPRLPDAPWRARQHAGHARRRTTAPRAEGGEHGSFNELQFPNRVEADGRAEPRRASTNGAASGRIPNYCVGLGVGRQHAAAALEAVPASGRHERSADRALAEGHPRTRRGPRPVRARRRRRRRRSSKRSASMRRRC